MRIQRPCRGRCESTIIPTLVLDSQGHVVRTGCYVLKPKHTDLFSFVGRAMSMVHSSHTSPLHVGSHAYPSRHRILGHIQTGVVFPDGSYIQKSTPFFTVARKSTGSLKDSAQECSMRGLPVSREGPPTCWDCFLRRVLGTLCKLHGSLYQLFVASALALSMATSLSSGELS
jgi:hypothetical protein